MTATNIDVQVVVSQVTDDRGHCHSRPYDSVGTVKAETIVHAAKDAPKVEVLVAEPTMATERGGASARACRGYPARSDAKKGQP